jgi:hypothetical protein
METPSLTSSARLAKNHSDRMVAITRARAILRDAFPQSDTDGAPDAQKLFDDLFLDPKNVADDARCLCGRVQEIIGKPNPRALQALVDLSQISGFEPLRQIAQDLLRSGTLAQKKMAANALAPIDKTAAATAEALKGLTVGSSEPQDLPHVSQLNMGDQKFIS